MRHKHHIIPKYMGGSDDPSNLVELTPQEHADAHNLLYHTYGNKQDRLAEWGLLGYVTKQEIIQELIIVGGRNGGLSNLRNKGKEYFSRIASLNKGKPKSEAHRLSLSGPKKITTCPHCGKSGGAGNMTRYHFDNCKEK